MSEYLIKEETLTSLCDAYRSLLLVEDTSLIGIEALTSFIGMLPIKIYRESDSLSIEDGILTVDLPSSCFFTTESKNREVKIIIKISSSDYILDCSFIGSSPLYVQHGSSSGIEAYTNGSIPASSYLSMSASTTQQGYYTVVWNVTDSFYQGIYNSNAELWVVVTES